MSERAVNKSDAKIKLSKLNAVFNIVSVRLTNSGCTSVGSDTV
jgi:hypothetical protein